MNEPILEPEEIEALMARVGPSEHADAMFASLPPLNQPEHVDAFHFDDAYEIRPDHYPMFVNLQERLVEVLDEQWDEQFKRDVSIQLDKLESNIYKDIVTIDKPQVYFVFEVEDYGRMMLTFDTAIIVSFVDAMLGGEGESTDNPLTLSPVEMRLSERIAEKMAQTLSNLWAPVQVLEFKPHKLDYDPQFLAMTGAMEPCFSTYFQAKISDDLTGQMGVHYPLTFLEPMLELLRVEISNEAAESDSEWTDSLMQCISETPADVCFELGRCQIDIGTFLSLKPGDALPLKTRSTDPCSLWIEDIPLFQARAGENNGGLAAEIIKPIHPGGLS